MSYEFSTYIPARESPSFTCISERRQLFLRINSQSIFKPNHLLVKARNLYLAHDSYVELQQLVRHMSEEIREAELVGRLSLAEARALGISPFRCERALVPAVQHAMREKRQQEENRDAGEREQQQRGEHPWNHQAVA